MNKILITLLLVLVGCSNNPVNSQGVDVTETETSSQSLYWMGSSSEPFTMTVNQSTLQMMWFFNNVTISGESIDTDDWVGAFNGDVCVGVKKWDTAQCGSGVCEIMLMGNDGDVDWTLPEGITDGYMEMGDIPTFKIYDTSENIYYDAIPSEDKPWTGNINWWIIDSLSVN